MTVIGVTVLAHSVIPLETEPTSEAALGEVIAAAFCCNADGQLGVLVGTFCISTLLFCQIGPNQRDDFFSCRG